MDTIKKTLGEILDLENMDAESRDEMLEKVSSLILQGTLAKIVEAMSEEEGENFDMFLGQNPNPEQLVVYLEDRIPNFQKMIQEEAEIFRTHAEKVMPDIQN